MRILKKNKMEIEDQARKISETSCAMNNAIDDLNSNLDETKR